MTNKDRAQLNVTFWGVLFLMFWTSKVPLVSLDALDKVFLSLSFAFYAVWVARYVWTIVREK